jgi:hypothetical protein
LLQPGRPPSQFEQNRTTHFVRFFGEKKVKLGQTAFSNVLLERLAQQGLDNEFPNVLWELRSIPETPPTHQLDIIN